jgi:hypothetical protein
MYKYFQNIKKRARKILKNNILKTYDSEMVLIYTKYFAMNYGKHFNKNYDKHFSRYMDENKIYANETHFKQIIDFFVLYYAENNITDVAVYTRDMTCIMEELADMGYPFTDNDALYCIEYGFFLPQFNIGVKDKNPYKKLKKIIYNLFEKQYFYINIGCKIPDIYISNFDDPLLTSYATISRCKKISNIKSLFNTLRIVPNTIHLQIVKNTFSFGPDKESIIKFFSKYNIK